MGKSHLAQSSRTEGCVVAEIASFVNSLERQAIFKMAPPKILTSKEAIEARLPDLRKGPYSTKSNALHPKCREQIFVGDETGVQGRFNQHVEQVITAACGAFGMDMIFGDHKACFGGGIEGIPDSVVMSILGVPRLIGEIKVDWVGAHHIQNFDVGSDEKRQRFVGKPKKIEAAG
ncbi:hypothetical protein N8T08_008677 [Aspergillus melleus]|uniref:Uncharacterized protein n=1 Tax=Aspergillus melleus TaxID=138277 RepID=A0ACC3BEL4_9EURO|nr:hypothetical protein N8T08_008677 [Aspergillus melleus]